MKQSDFTQEQLAKHAGLYSDQFQSGHPGYCDPVKARWHLDPAYPLEKFLCAEIPTSEDWTAWFHNEIAIFEADGMEEHADMYRAMLGANIEDEVIVLERDGKGYLWDGNHRAGSSFASNKTTIPAIVGIPVRKELDHA